MAESNINGLILAGGRSSRMNKNKALISYHGKPQHEHLFELLTPFCNQVYTSCKNADDIPVKFNPLHDGFDFDSPLNGIVSAFYTDSSCSWLSVPVDMPFIDVSLIQFLVENRDSQKTATCFLDPTGESPEPLLTIWEPQAHSRLMEYQKKGGVSPKEFLLQHDIKVLISPHPKYLTNINSQAELAAFRKSYIQTE